MILQYRRYTQPFKGLFVTLNMELMPLQQTDPDTWIPSLKTIIQFHKTKQVNKQDK